MAGLERAIVLGKEFDIVLDAMVACLYVTKEVVDAE